MLRQTAKRFSAASAIANCSASSRRKISKRFFRAAGRSPPGNQTRDRANLRRIMPNVERAASAAPNKTIVDGSGTDLVVTTGASASDRNCTDSASPESSCAEKSVWTKLSGSSLGQNFRSKFAGRRSPATLRDRVSRCALSEMRMRRVRKSCNCSESYFGPLWDRRFQTPFHRP